MGLRGLSQYSEPLRSPGSWKALVGGYVSLSFVILLIWLCVNVIHLNVIQAGFFGNIDANNSYSQYDLVVIPEVDRFNNTLASSKACLIDSDVGYVASQILPY